MSTISIDTPGGPATAHRLAADPRPGAEPRGLLVLGHGAGGGIAAPDLVAVTRAARKVGFSVALIEQPYRVAGRRAPPRAPALDTAWLAIIEHLRDDDADGLVLVVGGRSSGARVACRTAAATGAAAVLCLAFPLQPPQRAGKPEVLSRLPELDAVTVPVLVVQGVRDPFGMPPPGTHRAIVTVDGDHSLRSDVRAVETAVRRWLDGMGNG